MKKKKNDWNIRNVLAMAAAAGLAYATLYYGQTEYKPFSAAAAAAESENKARMQAEKELYIKKLESYYVELQNVNTLSKLDKAKAEVMEDYLFTRGGRGGKLEGRADDFVHITKFEEINLDPLLLWAISMHETAYGHSVAIKELNNVGGIFKGGQLHRYQSIYRGIVDMVLELRFNGFYDDVEGFYDNETTDKTIEQLGAIYCPVGAANDPTGLNKYWVPAITKTYNNLLMQYKEAIK